MKLLFDQNLSPRLVKQLADLFPNSTHVNEVGLGSASDRLVWEYARNNDYIIITKDSDFNELSLLIGFPPKIVWIRLGNCSTSDIISLVRANFSAIEALHNDASAGLLTLF